MNIIDFTQIDAPKRVTREEFRAQHAAEIGLPLEEFDRYLIVIPAETSQGWKSVPLTAWKRAQREARRK